MKGNIYTRQKCNCGGKFEYLEQRNGLFCNRCDNMATKKFYVKYGRDFQKRFGDDFFAAQRCLTGLRFKDDEDTFDPKDYKADSPLGFETMVKKWLKTKKKEIKHKSWVTYCGYMNRAMEKFENRNIKTISNGDIEDFIFDGHLNRFGNPISSKTRHEIKSVLVLFWKWASRREKYVEMPDFPSVKFEMGFRDIVDLSTQTTILNRVKKMCWETNPKIWWAIKLLTENGNVRPGELIEIKEADINLKLRTIQIKKTKESSLKRGKYLPLDDYDVNFVKAMPRALPHVYFFRHELGAHGVNSSRAGCRFSNHLLNNYWKRACESLGVEGVTVYSGTKHSTMTALSQIWSPEEVQRGYSEHDTKSALNRYLIPNALEKIRIKTSLQKMKGAAPPAHHQIIHLKNEKI